MWAAGLSLDWNRCSGLLAASLPQPTDAQRALSRRERSNLQGFLDAVSGWQGWLRVAAANAPARGREGGVSAPGRHRPELAAQAQEQTRQQQVIRRLRRWVWRPQAWPHRGCRPRVTAWCPSGTCGECGERWV